MSELTPRERDAAIERILSAGLRPRRTMRAQVSELYQVLGLRFLFWDTAQALVVSVVTGALVISGQLLFPGEYRHAFLFGLSPFFFALTVFLTETVERAEGLYGLKMTCRYTIREVTAFRILCFALIGTVFSVVLTVLYADVARDLLTLFPLSFAAFFLCAFLSLFLVRRFFRTWVYAGAGVVWLAVGLVPALILGARWETFLAGLPVGLTIGVAVCAAGLCLREATMLFSQRRLNYAIG